MFFQLPVQKFVLCFPFQQEYEFWSLLVERGLISAKLDLSGVVRRTKTEVVFHKIVEHDFILVPYLKVSSIAGPQSNVESGRCLQKYP
jgi:hypothetical protein